MPYALIYPKKKPKVGKTSPRLCQIQRQTLAIVKLATLSYECRKGGCYAKMALHCTGGETLPLFGERTL